MNVHHYRLFAILVAIVVIPPVHARAGAYSFSLIVDQASLPQPTQGLGSVLSPHALGLNKNGTAVFATYNVNFANLASGTRIYTANAGGPLNLIAAEGSSGQVIQNLAPFGVGESINDSGVVAYWKSTQAPTGSTEGIYRSDGATIYEVVATSSNQLLPQEPTAINNSGEVAFLVDNTIDATHSQQALMKGNGSTLVTVASVSNNRFSSIDNAYPAINSAGAVAFPAHGPVPLTSGIYVGSGGPLTTIISSTDNSVGYFNPSLNDFGKVAVTKTGGSILVGDGNSVTNYPDVFNAYGPSINNLGTIAYYEASLSSANFIDVVGPNGLPGRLIGTGSPLDGSTVLGIFAGPVLNNSGQIAFMAGLADGRAGLYIATPSPEPSSLVLATLGLVGLFGYAWRMRRRK